MTISFVVLFVLILCSAFFSASEIAFFSIGRVRVQQLAEQKKKHVHHLLHLKKHPERVLITVLIGNNIVNIGASVIATLVAVDLFGSKGAGIATGAMTFFILVFGEIVPKSFATGNAEHIALRSAPIIRFLQMVFYPLVLFFEHIIVLSRKLTRMQKATDTVTREELRIMAKMAHEHGTLEENEHRLMTRLFHFNLIAVADVMTPLTKVIRMNSEQIIDQSAHFIAHSGHSRIPLFADSENHIIGYVHVHNVLRALNSSQRDNPLKSIQTPILQVHESTPIDDVFSSMQKTKQHLAAVLHKDGVTLGIVSMEDLLEELMGEIHDETDTYPQIPLKNPISRPQTAIVEN